jgi:hypothetical protein
MCNLCSIITNQAAIASLFRVRSQYVGKLPPMPGMFPDYPALVIQNDAGVREMIMMRWEMPPPPKLAGLRPLVAPQPIITALTRLAEAGEPLPHTVQLLRGMRAGAEP